MACREHGVALTFVHVSLEHAKHSTLVTGTGIADVEWFIMYAYIQ